jgi:hypothetical protein
LPSLAAQHLLTIDCQHALMKNQMILLGTMTFALFLVLATTTQITGAQNATANQSMSTGNWTNQTGNMTASNMTIGNITTPESANMTS